MEEGEVGGYVTVMVEMRNTCKMLVGKSKHK
jgi:hypothetical protein